MISRELHRPLYEPLHRDLDRTGDGIGSGEGVTLVLTAPDGAYAGATAVVTNGTPIVYVDGEYAPITAGVGETIVPYMFIINGVETGEWFESPTTFPLTLAEGDAVHVKDAIGNLSNILTAVDDPDAQAYRGAVEAALAAPVTTTQKNALTLFYASEKAAGRWGSSHARIYLTVWGEEDANSIDMVTLVNGSFEGTVLQPPGYAEGNGTDGFLVTGTSSDIGLLTDSHCFSALVYREYQSAAYSAVLAGNTDSSGIQILENASHNIEFYSVSGTPVSISGATGVLVCSRTASNAVNVVRRTTSGVTSSTGTPASSALGNQIITGWARASGTNLFGNQRIGLFHIGWGLSVSEATDFSLNLKNLWESVTGLTLP